MGRNKVNELPGGDDIDDRRNGTGVGCELNTMEPKP